MINDKLETFVFLCFGIALLALTVFMGVATVLMLMGRMS